MSLKRAKVLLVLMLLATAGGIMTACHTVQGLGEDIEDTGRTVQNAL